MQWAALIAMIMEILKPILNDLVAKCMENRLQRAARRMPAEAMTFGSDGAATLALLDRAIADCRFYELLKIGALYRAKSVLVINGELRSTPLTADELAEGRALVGVVDAEI